MFLSYRRDTVRTVNCHLFSYSTFAGILQTKSYLNLDVAALEKPASHHHPPGGNDREYDPEDRKPQSSPHILKDLMTGCLPCHLRALHNVHGQSPNLRNLHRQQTAQLRRSVWTICETNLIW